MELEVVLRDGECAANGSTEARRLVAKLAVAPDTLCEGTYLDLLKRRDRRGA